MKIAKWGNSLAIRIPTDVVKALQLEEGDAVELTAVGPGVLGIAHDERRVRAIEALKSFRGSLPADYKFDREEANAR